MPHVPARPLLRRVAALVIAAAAVLPLAGCSDDDYYDGGGYYPPTYAMTASVSGEYYGFAATQLEAQYDPLSGYVLIRGLDQYSSGAPQITLQLGRYSGLGTYTLGGYLDPGVAEYSSLVRGVYITTAYYRGVLTLDQFDSYGGIASGRFEFDAVDAYGYVVGVRSGWFSAPLYAYSGLSLPLKSGAGPAPRDWPTEKTLRIERETAPAAGATPRTGRQG